VPEPLVGQPPLEVGGAAATTPVGTDVDEFDPSLFFAVTWTRSVFPESTGFSVYVLSVAPLIDEQLPPFASQRRQSYVKLIGVAPLHLPGSAVKVSPTWALPEIVGGDWLTGGLAAWDRPATTRTATDPIASSTSNDAVLFFIAHLLSVSETGSREAGRGHDQCVNAR